MTKDLTIIYATASKAPLHFRQKVFDELKKAAQDYEVYYIIDPPEVSSITNYYKELLIAAKKLDTPYIAFAEDDTLYPDEHFNQRPPDLETFAYNTTRWNLQTWSKPPFYSLRQKLILSTMIAPREKFIEIMNMRVRLAEKHMFEPGRGEGEKTHAFATYNPVVVFQHPDGFGYMEGKKGAEKVRATALPYWGSARKVMNDFYASPKSDV